MGIQILNKYIIKQHFQDSNLYKLKWITLLYIYLATKILNSHVLKSAYATNPKNRISEGTRRR